MQNWSVFRIWVREIFVHVTPRHSMWYCCRHHRFTSHSLNPAKQFWDFWPSVFLARDGSPSAASMPASIRPIRSNLDYLVNLGFTGFQRRGWPMMGKIRSSDFHLSCASPSSSSLALLCTPGCEVKMTMPSLTVWLQDRSDAQTDCRSRLLYCICRHRSLALFVDRRSDEFIRESKQ